MGKPKAKVNISKCLACCGCISICPQDAISWSGNRALINDKKCISCAICIRICPVGAISGDGF